MPRESVAIVGPARGGISEGVEASFREIGWHTDLFTFGSPARSALHRFALGAVPRLDREQITKSFNEILRRLVIRLAESRLSLILILKGDELSLENEHGLKESGVPTLFWMYDSASRCPWHPDIAQIAQHTYYIDAGDKDRFGASSSWLPLGFDHHVYSPHLERPRDIDVLFVGTVGPSYRRRRMFLGALARSKLGSKYRCAFIGSAGNVPGNARLKLDLARGRVEWISRRVPPQMLGDYIARAKVCVNIHQDDGFAPVNPLFFAIPGSGTCQLAEAKEHLRNWLRPGTDYVECEESSFIDTLNCLLSDDAFRDAVAREGRAACGARHTMVERARAITRALPLGATDAMR